MGSDPADRVPTLLDIDGAGEDEGIASIAESLGPDQAAVIVPLLLDTLSTEADDDWFKSTIRRPVLSHLATPCGQGRAGLDRPAGYVACRGQEASAEQLCE